MFYYSILALQTIMKYRSTGIIISEFFGWDQYIVYV